MPDSFVIPMLGRIDGFWIIIAIVVISSVWEWLKKQRHTGRVGGEPERPASIPPTAAPRPAATSDWEEELRRLLGGEGPVAKPPPSAAPPIRPIVIQEVKPVSPPRPAAAAAPVARKVPPPLADPGFTPAEKAVDVQLPALHESAAAYRRASHLQEDVARHLKGVEEMTERHLAETPAMHRQTLSNEVSQTIALLRSPGTARQAVIASIIFGPPKALAPE